MAVPVCNWHPLLPADLRAVCGLPAARRHLLHEARRRAGRLGRRAARLGKERLVLRPLAGICCAQYGLYGTGYMV